MFVLTARTCDGSTAMDRDIGRLLSSVRTLCFHSFDSNLEGSKVCIDVITVYSLGLFLPSNLNVLEMPQNRAVFFCFVFLHTWSDIKCVLQHFCFQMSSELEDIAHIYLLFKIKKTHELTIFQFIVAILVCLCF